jgi:uncharacterized protein
VHPNEELARREIEAIQRGDQATLDAIYADDFVLHYPGASSLAGTHTSFGEFVTKVDTLLDGGSLHRELHDALGTDDHVVQLITVTAEAKGRSHTWNAVFVTHVRDGQFTEAWFHVDDQYALDEFWNSLE